jgi:hypothetical protein
VDPPESLALLVCAPLASLGIYSSAEWSKKTAPKRGFLSKDGRLVELLFFG